MNVMAIEEGLPNFESGAQVFLVADAQILEQGNLDRARLRMMTKRRYPAESRTSLRRKRLPNALFQVTGAV